jgi:hypothetical protein
VQAGRLREDLGTELRSQLSWPQPPYLSLDDQDQQLHALLPTYLQQLPNLHCHRLRTALHSSPHSLELTQQPLLYPEHINNGRLQPTLCQDQARAPSVRRVFREREDAATTLILSGSLNLILIDRTILPRFIYPRSTGTTLHFKDHATHFNVINATLHTLTQSSHFLLPCLTICCTKTALHRSTAY